MLIDGDCIEYLADVRAPVAQKGTQGERRIVGRTIGRYPATYLLRGGYIRKVESPPAPPGTEKHAVTITAPDRERSIVNERDDNGRTDQESDHRGQDESPTEAD